jgi:hypothetical protein
MAKMGTVTETMTEMGRAKMVAGGYNTTDHRESRQKTYANCGYFDPFHWIPHIFGGTGEPLSIPLSLTSVNTIGIFRKIGIIVKFYLN